MKDFICMLCWRILWRWWPDRVIHIVPPPDWERGHTGWIREVSMPTVSDWQEWKMNPETRVIEKLDHQGRYLK